MEKTKRIIAVGIILLFMGSALYPVTATLPTQVQKEYASISTLNSKLQLSDRDFVTMDKVMPALMEKMKAATSKSELVNILKSFLDEHGRRLGLIMVLTLTIKLIEWQNKIEQLRPLRTTAFIMSWGFTNKLLSWGKGSFSLARPFTMWLYTGRPNALFNSRTIIIDFRPFSIKMVTGIQFGMMTNFIGYYHHAKNTLSGKTRTLFMGYAGSIRAFDLSPFNN
ncbi:MAG TPA: hypothetical protein VMT57_01670 [Candidatus Thermoplasmatota archaeon]|nr:hypothetical protein [Candidatus Thermoplasmatota archaeon]